MDTPGSKSNRRLSEAQSERRTVKLSEFRVRWRVLIPIAVLHMGALVAPFYFTWSAFWWAVGFWFAVGLFGVTVGYHRLLIHRSFKTTKLIEAFHLFWASLSLQQGPLSWARLHRAHHRHSDTASDPHSQIYGFLFGHAGWTFLSHKTIGRSSEVRKTPPDLVNDQLAVFFEKIHYPMFLISFLFFYLVGGLPVLLWVGCVRIVLSLHFTWMVNSITHRYGYRNFETKDKSTNNWVVALVTWGEGWHNNHHAYPYSARHGLKWWELDPSWLWIALLGKVGLAWDIRLPRKHSNDEQAS